MNQRKLCCGFLYGLALLFFLPLILDAQAHHHDDEMGDVQLRVLLFSGTGWYRHPDIPIVNGWLVKLGATYGMQVDVSETGRDLTEKNLEKYDVLLLNNANVLDKVLDEEQRAAVESWYQAGGGIVALHAVLVHQEGWPWIMNLGGCDFNSDSEFLKAKVKVDPGAMNHPTVKGWGSEFWYEADWTNHNKSVTGLPGVQVLLRVDESTYDPVRDYFKTRDGKPMGEDHPIAWTREWEGGRFFYTELGHDLRSLDTDFGRQHVIEGIKWAAAYEGETYQYSADSERQKDVPVGQVTKHSWKSKVYNGNYRDYYVYVPAQYDGNTPAALMVFQDGHAYVKEDGNFRTPIVFDNLIHQGKMPLTIGLFVDPGHLSEDLPENRFRASNRSIEYDELSDRYVTMLTTELIPELEKTYRLRDDPKFRAISGLSSGGICAFTAAWQRPDYFHKVLSHIGSFANIKGGHQYPQLIRSSAAKDIKVFLQDGSNDLNLVFGSWWLANLQMEAALEFKGYVHKFVPGTGGHNGKHGGAILPESLIWLWSDVVQEE